MLLLACLIFAFNPVQDNLILILRSIITLPFKLDVLLTYLFYLGIIFLALKTIIKRINWDSIALVFFFLISYLISLCFYGTGVENWLFVGAGILLSVSCYIVARSITDFVKFKSYLNVTAILIGVSSFFLVFVFNVIEEESYSQYYGYMVLPAVVISASVLFEKFKITHLLNLILSLLVIIFTGARGPFVCFALFVAIKFLLITGISLRKRIAITIIACTLIAVILFFFQDILFFLSDIGRNKGYSLRLLTQMADETLFIDEGRNSIKKYSMQLLMDNPLIGVGIYRDRILLSNLLGEGLNEVAGSYPHNIFLEVLLHFGLIIGGLMIIWFLWIIYRVIFRNKNKDTKDVILIFFAFGFNPLLFSGSYLKNGYFFLFLGFCINILIDARIAKKVQ